MRIAVKDANVLIDLAEADLLLLWFGLGIPTHTTDLVLDEVERTAQRAKVEPFVTSKLLLIHEARAVEMAKIASVANEHGLSPADASALLLAKRLRATLVTGDGRLRKVACGLGVTVCGVLWIFDHLVQSGHLHVTDAARRLRHVMNSGTFLPASECEERLRRWDCD